MNKVILMGRLTRDPDIRWTQSSQGDMCIARYSLAVDRRGARDGGQTADFPNCVAFGKNGEFANKYLRKGTKVVICGRLQTGSYTDKNGNKVYTTDVVVEEHDFAESKNAAGGGQSAQQGNGQGFTNYGGQNYSQPAPHVPPQQGFGQPAQEYHQQSFGEGFMSIPEGADDSGLPWN